MDCSTPGFPVHHYLLEFAQTHVHWIGDATQPHFSSCPQSVPASESFPMSWLFPSGGQSIGASATAIVLLMNIQEFPLGWTGLICLQSKGLSRVFSNPTVQKHQFFVLFIVQVSHPYMTTGKDPDAGNGWRQEEKGMTEDEMFGWHHWLNGNEF